MKRTNSKQRTNSKHLVAALACALALAQPACVFVGGYRSGSGWFFFPGGLSVLLLVVVLLVVVLRRRR